MLNLMERFSSTPTGREGEGDAATAFENGSGAGGRGTRRRALARRPGQGEGDTAGRDVATPGGPAPAPAAPAAARRTASAGVGNRLMKQIRNSILRFFFFSLFSPKSHQISSICGKSCTVRRDCNVLFFIRGAQNEKLG